MRAIGYVYGPGLVLVLALSAALWVGPRDNDVRSCVAMSGAAAAADDGFLIEAVRALDAAAGEALLRASADVNAGVPDGAAAAAGGGSLIEAVRALDAAAVEALLRASADVNAAAPDGATALHWAAYHDALPLAERLLAAGAGVDAANDHGVTPLSLACGNGSAGMVSRLLRAGAAPDAARSSGETPLMTCARTGSVEAVRALLDAGADPSAAETWQGQTALMWAAAEEHVEVVRALLAAGADVRARTAGGFTALLIAAREDAPALAGLLLDAGADVNAAAPGGVTPLLVATVRGHTRLAAFLLARGADPNACEAGYTPLHWAAGAWHTELTGRLRGIDTARDEEWRALNGLGGGKRALVEALLAHGADPDARLVRHPPQYGYASQLFRVSLAGATPFLLAAMDADVEVMDALAAAGADTRLATDEGTTPLMVASGLGRVPAETRVTEADTLDAVRFVLELGADVNAVNADGRSALHGAAHVRSDAAVRLLVGRGAAVQAADRRGITPLMIAEGRGYDLLPGLGGGSTADLLRALGSAETTAELHRRLQRTDRFGERPDAGVDGAATRDEDDDEAGRGNRTGVGVRAAPAAAEAHDAAAFAPSGDEEAAAWRAVLDRYCVTCHNGRLRTGNLALDGVDTERVGADAEVWEKVLRKLRTQAMPPPRRPRPAAETYGAFAAWLEAALDRAAAERPNPGRPTIRRLNRLEYANAVRDLLDLEIDGAALLPRDDLAYGFDNNAGILTVAPGSLERYLAAALRISRLAVGDPTIEADAVRTPRFSLLAQDDRMGEDLPFGSRGGAAVRRHFPLDGEYVVRIRLRSRHAGEPEEIDVRVDGVRRALLRVGGWPAGADSGAARVVEPDEPVDVRFPARAGTRVVSVSFTGRTAVTEGMAPSRLPLWTFVARRGGLKRMALDSLEIEGPFSPDTFGRGPGGAGETASRRRIFVCRPAAAGEEEPCADEILRTLARRAFRRPVTGIDGDALRAFYAEGRREGGFDAGIQRALESLLVDPEFLFRVERDPPGAAPGAPYRLSGIELASRLSFFLWSSIPDDALLDAAEAGALGDAAELERQVRRMLADDRAGVLVSSFAAQWLHLRRMRTVAPDVNAFPEFDENLRAALVRETELFVESQIRDDRSVADLLDADYTFVNERLARHYGIPGVYGSRFRRVDLPAERRGLLGHGSILTVTSLATRTSPVVRGKWVLENLLGAPPPPPPPDVPELPERSGGGPPASLRARLEAHRAHPACSNCHARMDPLGFALENFDAVGRWRAADASGAPIDPSGVLPGGTAFAGFADLRGILRERREEFVATVAEKLLTYALGRGVEYYDRPAIRAVVREAAAQDYRWSALILGVARSLPFQMRRADS